MAVPFETRNFQKELERKLADISKSGEVPKLLLHSCCAPCSSYVIEYLSEYFHITVFYYNPNISQDLEYRKRVEEQKRFIKEFPFYYIKISRRNIPSGDLIPDINYLTSVSYIFLRSTR